MQEELNEFEYLKVWELVPRPDKVMVITLKWIYKVKLDELGGILKTRLDWLVVVIVKKRELILRNPLLQWLDLLFEFSSHIIFEKKYVMESSNPVDTLMVEKSKLDEDTQGKAVDPTHYRGMVGTLMYLTASRTYLTFALMQDAVNAGCQVTRRSSIWRVKQQQALDDALVPREQRLRIGNCNYRLSTTFKPKEPTFQVALDVLSLTPFYQAFLISASVPAIYMHEFWATVSYHKHCIKFKLNKKNHSFDLETFRDMLQICPNLPGQKFVDPPFEEEIIAFIRELGYLGDIKSLSDIKVDTLYQPWRTFETIINKCLSGKVTGLDQLRLSRAQIIWGMY
ncbi:hypothetical protein Tco_1071770, partial [Tanacetum coccineum]